MKVYFWIWCIAMDQLEDDFDNLPNKSFEDIISSYLTSVHQEFEQAREDIYATSWKKRTKQLLSALLVQQVTVLKLLGENNTSLTATVATLFLRIMLEASIKIAWIKLAPDDNALALMKSDLRSSEQLSEDMQAFASKNNIQVTSSIAAAKDWLDHEEAEIGFRQGKLKELDPRDMALAAGEDSMRLYRTFYITLSGGLHSTWSHISRYNLTRSLNPLHKAVFVPTIRCEDRDIIFFVVAAEIFDHSIKTLGGRSMQSFAKLKEKLSS